MKALYAFTNILVRGIVFLFIFLDNQTQGKNSKSGKNKGKTGRQPASASLHEHTDSRNNLIGGKQC